jgi:cbb3-type cytochrome oxidase cytochrome c subunit
VGGKLVLAVFSVVFVVFLLGWFVFLPDGAGIFKREGCYECHSFKGQGGAGPDLTAVTGRRTNGWIKTQIRNPKANNPNSRMPAFGHLSDREIRAIIRYLKG